MTQGILSRDGTLKAIIRPRADGLYEIEFQQFFREHSPDFGDHSGWKKLPGHTIAASLTEAVELASRRVGAGTEDYFDDETE